MIAAESGAYGARTRLKSCGSVRNFAQTIDALRLDALAEF
jgi:hypothetical protein